MNSSLSALGLVGLVNVIHRVAIVEEHGQGHAQLGCTKPMGAEQDGRQAGRQEASNEEKE